MSGAQRYLIVGASSTRICGVRDYARVLADELDGRAIACGFAWWDRDRDRSLRSVLRGAGRWTADVQDVAGGQRPQLLLWHYSAFAYGWRGIPLAVPLVCRGLARTGIPVAVVLHEFAYPWGRRGWRGAVLAGTQRIALASVMRMAACGIVTTERRLDWLRTRRWLAKRALGYAPVFASVSAGERSGPEVAGSRRSLGVFGLGAEDFVAEPVIGALTRLRGRGLDCKLHLLGASTAGPGIERRWRRLAARFGCAESVEVSGPLEARELGRRLVAMDVIVFPDASGPSSRKSSLAAALASGRAVVAFDGPERWERLVDEGAVVLCAATAGELANEVETLLRNDQLRERQGKRAAAFYDGEMLPSIAAERILGVISRLPERDRVA